MPSRPARVLVRIAGLLAAMTGCTAERPGEYRIGLLTAGAGQFEPVQGTPAIQGARIAVDEVNAAGGIRLGGRALRLVLVERAVETRADAVAEGARALVNLDRVDAMIVGLTSTLSIAAAGVTEQAGVPLIATMASSPAVTEGRTLVARLAFLDAFQGDLLARFAYDTLRVRRAAILRDAASRYGAEISALFTRTFEARGGRVTGVETFTTDVTPDFRPQLRRLLAGRPDALLLPNYAIFDSIQARQARALGFRGAFLGTDAWDPTALRAEPATHGAVLVANWVPTDPRPRAQAFVATFQTRHAHLPRTAAAAAYDAVHLLASAAGRAASLDGPAVARAVREAGEVDGAMARYSFDGTGDPRRGGFILQILRDREAVRFADPGSR